MATRNDACRTRSGSLDSLWSLVDEPLPTCHQRGAKLRWYRSLALLVGSAKPALCLGRVKRDSLSGRGNQAEQSRSNERALTAKLGIATSDQRPSSLRSDPRSSSEQRQQLTTLPTNERYQQSLSNATLGPKDGDLVAGSHYRSNASSFDSLTVEQSETLASLVALVRWARCGRRGPARFTRTSKARSGSLDSLWSLVAKRDKASLVSLVSSAGWFGYPLVLLAGLGQGRAWLELRDSFDR